MSKITYTAKLMLDDKQHAELMATLELSRSLFNYISPIQYDQSGKPISIVTLHRTAYQAAKSEFPAAKSQLIIKAEQAVLAAYRSVKSNKQKIAAPVVKKGLSLQLDKRLYSFSDGIFRLTTLKRRVACGVIGYDRLQKLLAKYEICDPSLFVRNGSIYIAITFDVPDAHTKSTQAIGVDLGYRRYAATSDGKLIVSPEYNAARRKTRYLKRCLQRTKTVSAKRHLKRLRRRERHQSKNFNHHLANAILNTKANVIVLEDLNVKHLKRRKHPNQSNRRTQVCLSELRRILTYKAALVGKQVVCVNPRFTSQMDCITGREGTRKGCRFYSSSGLIYDADINAAVNIARRSQLPFSQCRLLDGQGSVNSPYASGFSRLASLLL